MEKSRGEARKAVNTGHLVPRRDAIVQMHPQCRVLGRGSEPAYRKKRGALDQDWIRTVLYFRGREERVTEKTETVVGEGSGKGGTEKCTRCQEGILAPGLRLSLGKETAVGTVLKARNRSPRRRPTECEQLGIR